MMSTSTRKIRYHLDQDEVLQHLQQLGYKDISQDQLKDFTKDLKRLIKYDVMRNKGLSSSSGSSGNNSQLASSYSSERHLLTRTTSSLESSRSESSTSSFSGTSSSSASTPPSTRVVEQTIESDLAEQSKPKTKRVSKLKEPPRHDRVALYHYYKKFWKQYNLPEDSRNLNWDTKDEPRWGAGERLCAWK